MSYMWDRCKTYIILFEDNHTFDWRQYYYSQDHKISMRSRIKAQSHDPLCLIFHFRQKVEIFIPVEFYRCTISVWKMFLADIRQLYIYWMLTSEIQT